MNANVKVIIVTALAVTVAAFATNWRLYASVPAPVPNVRGWTRDASPY